MITEGFDFSHNCSLKSRSRSFTMVSRAQFSSIYHYTKFERNWYLIVQIHANVKGLFFVVAFVLFCF